MQNSDKILKKRQAFRDHYTGILFKSSLNTVLVIQIWVISISFTSSRISWDVSALTIIPIAFFYAEAATYLSHRYQQHKKIRVCEKIYEMHTLWHHSVFSSENMAVDSFKDMNMVILPFFIHGLVLGAVYFPLGLLIEWYFKSDLGWLVLFSITLNSMWYEFVHTLSHTANPPILKKLANHHRQHHNPGLMGKYNFGIGTTIFDTVFGSRHH